MRCPKGLVLAIPIVSFQVRGAPRTAIDLQITDYSFDRGLAAGLVTFFRTEKAASVLDLGAGVGWYTAILAMQGIDVVGLDANLQLYRSTPKVDSQTLQKSIYRSLVEYGNVAMPLELGRRFSWVLSLEVAEHLPRHREPDFLLNVHNGNVDGIVLSWARRAQPGHGHINCRSVEEVVAIFTALGYKMDAEAQESLRTASDLWWFQENLLVFRRNEGATASTGEVLTNSGLSSAAPSWQTLYSDIVEGREASRGCCNDRASMSRLSDVTRFGICFGRTGTTYELCCEPEHRMHFDGADRGSLACFSNSSGFSYYECCTRQFKAWWRELHAET